MYYIVLLAISLVFAALLYFIAAKRGANKAFWSVMGFMFGPFALPFVFLSRSREKTIHS